MALVASSDRQWRACHDFQAAVTAHPEASAITVEGQTYSYAQLFKAAIKIAHTIAAQETADKDPVVAVFAHRGFVTYAGVLAALMRGCTYVVLGSKFPADRNGTILERSGAFCVIGRHEDADKIQNAISLSGGAAMPLLFELNDLPDSDPEPLPDLRFDSPYAYCMFTSGSTGIPKGVPIRHSNLECFLDDVFEIEKFYQTDRMSQCFELTFDVSVYDLFVCWRAGAHMIVPSDEDLAAPANFVANQGVTVWASVPTLAQKMLLQGALEPGALSGLRLSMFIGEGLPIDLARIWARATGQRVINWYGPTEATIACTVYEFPDLVEDIDGAFNFVSIGRAFPRTGTHIVDSDMNDLPDGELGELLLSGPQVADGYLNDVDKTKAAFVKRPGDDTVYYRTGDRVMRDAQGNLQFRDRIDNQIKMHGYRIELGEIESKIRDASGGCNAIVVPLPVGAASPTALVAAVESLTDLAPDLLERACVSLPDYMTPTRVLRFDEFPKNASAKTDRKAVGGLVDDQLSSGSGGGRKKKIKAKEAKQAQLLKQRDKRRRKKLVSIAKQINPAIEGRALRRAPNLMDGGLDSMGFVAFTLAIEKEFGLKLDQGDVSELSYLPIKKISRRIYEMKRRAPKTKDVETSGPESHVRLQRIFDFVDLFPQYVRDQPNPLAGFIGSSSFLRGIVPDVVVEHAAKNGVSVSAANGGIAALNVEGIAELCEFVRDTMQASGQRLKWGVVELDPMHVSTIPPTGDWAVVKDYRDGKLERGNKTNDGWPVATGGAPFTQRGKPQTHPAEPDWMRNRNSQVRETYLGRIPMDSEALNLWIRGVAAIAEVSDQLFAIVPPLNDKSLAADRAASPDNNWSGVLTEIRQRLPNLTMIEDTAFDLETSDFVDKNHMNWWQGNATFSRQVVDLILKS